MIKMLFGLSAVQGKYGINYGIINILASFFQAYCMHLWCRQILHTGQGIGQASQTAKCFSAVHEICEATSSPRTSRFAFHMIIIR